MPNYQEAKIYKIYSDENENVYYGSTCNTLNGRMTEHKNGFKRYKEGKKNYVTSYEILELTNYKIELVENYPCNSKEELLQREGFYIRNNNCVNKIISGRTSKEYHKDYFDHNKKQLLEYKKEWYKQNKDKINEKGRARYNQKKEQLAMAAEDINII